MNIREAVQQVLCQEAVFAVQDSKRTEQALEKMSDRDLIAAFRRVKTAGLPGQDAYLKVMRKRKLEIRW